MLIYFLIALPFVWLAVMIFGGWRILRFWRILVSSYDVIQTIDPAIKRSVGWYNDGTPIDVRILTWRRRIRLYRHLARLVYFGAPAQELVGEEVLCAVAQLRRTVLRAYLLRFAFLVFMIVFFAAIGFYPFILIPVLALVTTAISLMIIAPKRWPSTDEIKERIARDDQSA